MAVPTGYQHQNRGKILIFYFKNIFGVTVMSPEYVLGTFLVRFWYACAHAVPRKFSPVFDARTNLLGPVCSLYFFARTIFFVCLELQ